MDNYFYYPRPAIYQPSLDYTVAIPINLAKSLEGKYFVGYADELTFGIGTSAWARLYNPPCSGVNLHVTVWTVVMYLNPLFVPKSGLIQLLPEYP